MPKTNTIQAYRTTTASAVPSASALAAGELAVNLTDKKLFVGDAAGTSYIELTRRADAAAGASTALPIQLAGTDGALTSSSANFYFNNSTSAVNIVGELFLGPSAGNASSIRTAQTSFTIFGTSVTTLSVGLSATSITLGSTTGTTTIRNPTVVGSQATQELFDTVATTMRFARAATSITMGATTGTASIRNPTLRIGNTVGTISTTTGATTNDLTLAPNGQLVLTTNAAGTGTSGGLLINYGDAALGTGWMRFSGGDIEIVSKSTDGLSYEPCLVKLKDADESNWVAFKAPTTIASNVTWTLPSVDGTNGQVLSTNGSGTLSWTTAGGGETTAGLLYLIASGVI